MTKLKWILSAACISAAICPVVFADQAQLPELPDYYAYAPEKPPVSTRVQTHLSWLKNFYVTGEFGRSFAHINKIENISTAGQNQVVPPVAKTSAQATANHYGIVIGYQLRQGGIFSRIEVEYLNRGKLNYNADPLLAFPSDVTNPPIIKLNNTIKNQTILFKIYYDMNFDFPVIPYIQGGAGIAFNKTESKGVFIDPIFHQEIDSEESNSRHHFAWDAGAGVRIKFTEHLYAGIGYEFDYLGDLNFGMQTDVPNQPISLRGKGLYSHSVTAGLTLKA